MTIGMHQAISLFTGGGGLDLGLEQAGFKTRACVEIDPVMCRTLRQNRPNWEVIEGDIHQISTKQIMNRAGLDVGEADLVVGGPPCQPFSKSAYWVPGRLQSLLQDPRALLLGEFARVVKESRPRAFIMENVFGLAYSHGRPALDAVVETLHSEGYNISWQVLNSADFGVPQKRQRVFIVGHLGNMPFKFPTPTHGTKKTPYVTVAEALQGVPDKVETGEVVTGQYADLLPKVPPGDNYLYFTEKRGHPEPLFKWRSKYWSFLLKLAPELPSWTVQASPGPYIGPFHWENRRLRIAEVKRIQTFPDDWHLSGSRAEQWKQLGNAVPCELAKAIGDAVRVQCLEQLGDIEGAPQPKKIAVAQTA